SPASAITGMEQLQAHVERMRFPYLIRVTRVNRITILPRSAAPSPGDDAPTGGRAKIRRSGARPRRVSLPRNPSYTPGKADRQRGPVSSAFNAIDCDVHPTVPDMKALLPYLDDFWRETVEERGINSLETVTYPPNAPLSARPEWRSRNG